MTAVEELRREHRWNQAWAYLPYGLLLLAYGISLAEAKTDPKATLAVVAGFAVWHWWFIVAHPGWWERRRGLMAGYYLGVLVFSTLLLTRAEAFELFVPACYVLAFVALPGWWAYVGVAVANVPWLIVLHANLGSVLINLGIITPLAALFGTMIRVMEREAIRRREVNSELVAMAADNARLSRQAGVAEERARLAREIHDTVAQGLTGIVTQLEAVGDLPPEQARRLDTARTLARTSLDEVRRSIEALRPGPLQNARLSEAVRVAMTTWSEQHDVAANFTVTGTPVPAHAEVEVTVLRAAQEALANVGRHARAGRVDVTLSYMEDVIVLDVRDDGVGFGGGPGGGFGLVALRDRVLALAGSVEIESAPGQGTTVNVTLPAIGAGS
ncbi:sensor histidine kinase [Actinoplanes sp. LDG1-06]|uniref:Oxygen sensor histidine kinase NreB n=1 Tax=Paractinoplanes ovalisporus TaxID=2810368 RepID=A0ABS2AQC9_9ACTN|nr:sensor histidine kinase [Actinoplanes ovalisporus]MBM2622046.1 sensor histidine kinase [Actinoplanes ovalisporus]